MGNKGRPFYRIVVAKSNAGRDGSFIEVLGTRNPVARPATLELNKERALHWLLEGAQPTETVAYLLKQSGVLDDFFAQRPEAKKRFKSLDKRTAAMTVESAVTATVAATAPEPAAAAPVETPAEAPAETPAEAAAEAPAEAAAEEPAKAE